MTASPVRAEHILMVCWALNDPGDEGQLREIVEAVAAQRDIPGVLSIEQGARTKWAGPREDFDYAMILKFDNFASVRAYPPHPIHQDLVAVVLRLGSNIRGFWIDL